MYFQKVLWWPILLLALPVHGGELATPTHKLALAPNLAAIALNEATEENHLDALTVNAGLTLHDVLEKTFIRNPQQAILQSRRFVVDANHKLANALLPNTPSIALGHQNDAVGGNRGEREWQADLELPIWHVKQRDNRQIVASALKENLSASNSSLKIQVAGVLRDALWDIALNENSAILAKSQLTLSQALANDIDKKVRAGELAKTDALLAQQDTLVLQTQLLRAEAEVMHARHRYSVLTGLSEMPANFEEQPSMLTDYSQSPIWLESQTKVELAQSQKALAYIESRENPQLILNARSIKGAFDITNNESVGIKIRIPFGADSRASLIQSSAETNLGNIQSERESLRLNLETAMHEAEHVLNVSRSELSLTQHLFEIAQESSRLARKAFQLGETDVTTLLRIEAQTFAAERAFNARKIQLQWDIARYNQAVGVLP